MKVALQLAVSGDEPSRVAWHSVPPLVNVTVPVGTPNPGACAATVADSEMVSPATGEDGLDITVVIVAAFPTETVVVPKDPTSLVSPPYVAVTVPEVAPVKVVVQLAASGLLSERVPVQLTPSPEKETVPLGVPAPGAVTATVAATVTVWPTTGDDGLTETADVAVASWFTVSVVVPGDPASLTSPP